MILIQHEQIREKFQSSSHFARFTKRGDKRRELRNDTGNDAPCNSHFVSEQNVCGTNNQNDRHQRESPSPRCRSRTAGRVESKGHQQSVGPIQKGLHKIKSDFYSFL